MLDVNNKTLLEVFNEIVSTSYREHKEEMSQLVVAADNEFLLISNEARITFSYKKDFRDKIIKKSKKQCEEFGLGGFLTDDNEMLESDDYCFIYINPSDVELHEKYNLNNKNDFYDNVGLLCHELGHFLVDDLEESGCHLSECIAETYSALMHVKYFGGNTGSLEYIAKELSAQVVFASEEHYVSPVIFAVDSLKDKIDISKLSVKDLAGITKEIALAYSYNDDTLIKISDAYESAYNDLTDKEGVFDEYVIKSIAETMLENKENEDIYRTGRLLLSNEFYINSIKEFRKTNSDYWEDIYNKFNFFEKENNFELNSAKAIDNKKGYSVVDKIADRYKNNLKTKNPAYN